MQIDVHWLRFGSFCHPNLDKWVYYVSITQKLEENLNQRVIRITQKLKETGKLVRIAVKFDKARPWCVGWQISLSVHVLFLS